VASNIQMSMVPKIFPPFPTRDDLDLSASLVPAKEVGGDLYDFFIRDEKLHFCIGDVSGKGVPASLLMAVTRTQYRTLASHYDSPSKIVTSINDGMSEMNENSMFVTFFCGVLDLQTGVLRYCNAGHNAPYILTDAIRELDVVPNLPLGILEGMSFEEQQVTLHYDDALFLFTDGLNEAENINHDQFGDEGVRAVLHTRRDADHHLKAMQQAVADFRGEADQSDDLTMLFLHYLKK
jgi:sigma-B regulation protein RsbU (phosphoserine phosphatase)